MRSLFSIALISLLFLTGCGYRLGGSKPSTLSHVSHIQVMPAENMTQYPRLSAQLANHLTDALIQDGLYKVGTENNADAYLQTTISSVGINQIRGSRTTPLFPEELLLRIQVQWQVVDMETGQSLQTGKEIARTRFFMSDNFQNAQNNAFPDALSRVSRQIVSSLSNSL